MDIEVEQITIIIDTNRPNKSKNDLLTKHIFYGYNPSYKDIFYTEFPFFTKSVKIPKDYLRRKTFNEKIMFFFNRKTFIDTLSNKKNFHHFQETEQESEEIIINYNLSTMIELLFTTVYPSINDNNDSFNKLILKRESYILSLDGTVPKPFKSLIPSLNVDFSYIILDGKDYTVTSTCLLNDIVNHPEYNKMMHRIVELKKWKIQTKNEIESKMIKIKKKIRFNIDHNFDNYKKVKYELDKNKRNYSYYNSNRETEGKAHMLFTLFDKFIDIIDIIENIDNIDKFIEIAQDDKNREDSEENRDRVAFLDFIKSRINGKHLPQRIRYTIDKYTIDILKDVKTRLDDKYSFQTIRSLIDEILMLLIIKLKYFDSKKSYNYDNNTYKEFVKYYKIDYTKNVGSKESTDDYDVISGEIEKYFKLNYKKYAELIDYVSEFVFPNRVTSNKKLQIMINDFFDNNNDFLEDFMNDVFEKYIKDNDVNNTQRMAEIESSSLFTGVNSYNTENNFGKLKYEAYVSFNLISGKLTQEDLSNISCEYKDEELGTYFDRSRVKSAIHVSTLIDREKMIKNVGSENAKKVSGGKRKTRNTRKKKTMKCKSSSRKKNNVV